MKRMRDKCYLALVNTIGNTICINADHIVGITNDINDKILCFNLSNSERLEVAIKDVPGGLTENIIINILDKIMDVNVHYIYVDEEINKVIKKYEKYADG